MTLYWMPVDLQFMTFSLLVLFYAFLLYQPTWETKRVCLFTIYFLVNVSVCLTTATYIFIGCDSNGCHKTSLNKVHHIYMAIQFSILVTVYGYFGYRLHKRRYSSTFPWSVTPTSLSALTLISWLVFVSRWLYNILVTVNSARFSMALTYGDDGLVDVNAATFVLLCLWEVLPSAMVLFFFRDIPRTQDTLATRLCPGLCRQKSTDSQRGSQSPARINSDPLLAPACDYDLSSGCACSGCVGAGCLSTPCVGPLTACLCCFKRHEPQRLFDDSMGLPGYAAPNYPALEGGAARPLYGYDGLGAGVDAGYDILSVPMDDDAAYGDYRYGYERFPLSPVGELAGGGAYGMSGAGSYASGAGSFYGMGGADEQQLQAQIQAHIQAQLEHHARQNDYLG